MKSESDLGNFNCFLSAITQRFGDPTFSILKAHLIFEEVLRKRPANSPCLRSKFARPSCPLQKKWTHRHFKRSERKLQNFNCRRPHADTCAKAMTSSAKS